MGANLRLSSRHRESRVQETDILQLISDHWKSIGVKLFVKPSQRDILRGRVSNGETVMSTWQGLNRGLATPEMNPEELAPISRFRLNGLLGANIMKATAALARHQLYRKSLSFLSFTISGGVPVTIRVRKKSGPKCSKFHRPSIYNWNCFGGLQPIVVSKKLQNIPEEGIWAFEPTLYFGQYLPDTFWLKEQ